MDYLYPAAVLFGLTAISDTSISNTLSSKYHSDLSRFVKI